MAFDRNAWQREYRKRNKNNCTNKYEKTIKGFLMRKYRNMLSRVSGVQSQKAHLYKGKSIVTREQFYIWATSSFAFIELWNKYVDSCYDRKLCPTVDRIDSKLGYDLENMQWITHSENSRKGSLSRWEKDENTVS
jgi:hypothetical protein